MSANSSKSLWFLVELYLRTVENFKNYSTRNYKFLLEFGYFCQILQVITNLYQKLQFSHCCTLLKFILFKKCISTRECIHICSGTNKKLCCLQQNFKFNFLTHLSTRNLGQ